MFLIKLLEELLAANDEQLGALQTSLESYVKSALDSTVVSAVQGSVNTEFKSFNSFSIFKEAKSMNMVKNAVKEDQ